MREREDGRAGGGGGGGARIERGRRRRESIAQERVQNRRKREYRTGEGGGGAGGHARDKRVELATFGAMAWVLQKSMNSGRQGEVYRQQADLSARLTSWAVCGTSRSSRC